MPYDPRPILKLEAATKLVLCRVVGGQRIPAIDRLRRPLMPLFVRPIDVSNVLINTNDIVELNAANFNFAVKTENLKVFVTIRGEIDEALRQMEAEITADTLKPSSEKLQIMDQMYKDICTGNGTKYREQFIDHFLRILKGDAGEVMASIIEGPVDAFRITEEDAKKFYEKADRPMATE
ncbi:hypothetical protein QBC32DRAFT_319300 [Pseudoneurospora amorphoporcata]|uniref:Uncharacterized protein n=1 Tax=Pseudoneurospora amorphoporcata TaxID=241081 RepID=A0AAN6NJM1_9PEZI|nr:hypothetical protein QBC32DRAFT_319300 [Pseudoneurospora amorphoporcata]